MHWEDCPVTEYRLMEHKDAYSEGESEKLAIAEHAWEYDHPIDLNDTKIMDHTSRQKELIVKEALQIRTVTEEGSLNKDRGVELCDCWVDAVRRCAQMGQCH